MRLFQRNAFRKAVLLASCTILCVGFKSAPLFAEILPRQGVFDGVYHRDRWGVGHFAFYFVDPKLHDTLNPYEGKRINLKVELAEQPLNPGPAIIREIGDITPLDELPLGIEIAVRAIDSEQHQYELTCFFVNKSERLVDASLSNLVVKVSHPVETEKPDEPALFFPQYTRGQMAIKRDQTVQWLNGHLVAMSGVVGYGRQLRIQPGQRFPVVTPLQLRAEENELRIAFRPRVGENWLDQEERWFRYDASSAKEVVGADGDDGLSITDVQRSTASDGWERWRLTINAPKRPQRSIVACSRGSVPLVVGVLSAVDANGKAAALKIKQQYSCSNLGEPWELTPIPDGGIATEILLKPTSAERFEFRVLADDGLETLSFDAPR